jgi:hypothetical protein
MHPGGHPSVATISVPLASVEWLMGFRPHNLIKPGSVRGPCVRVTGASGGPN